MVVEKAALWVDMKVPFLVALMAETRDVLKVERRVDDLVERTADMMVAAMAVMMVVGME